MILRLAVLIPECDRHTHRQTDRHTTTAYTALSIGRAVKIDHIARPTNYNYHCRQRALVDSEMYSYYHIFER